MDSVPKFTTASGKLIVISEAAMKEAEKKMKMEEPDEGVLALSQSMILPSTNSSLKKPVENEAAFAADTGEIVVLVTQVHRPTYFIADKNYFISEAAFKILACEGGADMPLAAVSCVGSHADVPGLKVKIVAWKNHGDWTFEVGHYYRLSNFETKNGGDLWTTDKAVVQPLVFTPERVPARKVLSFDDVMSLANGSKKQKLVDMVAKVLEVGDYTPGNGQNVSMEDSAGKTFKIKFQLGIEKEGVGSIFRAGNVVACVNLQLQGPVFKRHNMLLSSATSEFYASHPMPTHLGDSFELLLGALDLEFDTEMEQAPTPSMKRSASRDLSDDDGSKVKRLATSSSNN